MGLHSASCRSGHCWWPLAGLAALIAASTLVLAPTGGSAALAAKGTGRNLIVNGTFDNPMAPAGNFATEGAGRTVPGWVVAGNVDVISGSFWQPSPGSQQSLQLCSTIEGSVTQAVKTTPGTTYLLQWYMAGNYQGPPTVKTMHVYWDGRLVDAPTFNTTGHSSTSMGWAHMAISVTATGPTSSVEFADALGPAAQGYGSVLGTVSLLAESETVNGFAVTNSTDAYSTAERQMLAEIPGHAVVRSTGTPVSAIAAAAANQVQDRSGLLIIWTVSPSTQFIHQGAPARLAGAQVLDKYLTVLLTKSKRLYLAALRADRVPVQGSGNLDSWWGVEVRSLSTTRTLMTFEIATTATTSTTSWSGVPGISSSASQALAPKALAAMLYYTKTIAIV